MEERFFVRIFSPVLITVYRGFLFRFTYFYGYTFNVNCTRIVFFSSIIGFVLFDNNRVVIGRGLFFKEQLGVAGWWLS